MSALDGILSGTNDPACVLYGTDDPYFDLHDRQEATAELSALRAENARMREALEKCRDVLAGHTMTKQELIDALRSARAALGGRDDD